MLQNKQALLQAAVAFLFTVSTPMAAAIELERKISKRVVDAVVIERGITPRLTARDLFKRQCGSDPVLCFSGSEITCCRSGWRCTDGGTRCVKENPFGLSKGARIGIGVGVTVAFLLFVIAGLAIFFYCCRRAKRIVAAHGSNNFTQGAYVPPPPPAGYPQMGGTYANPQPYAGQGIPLQNDPMSKPYEGAGGYSQTPYDPYSPPQQPPQSVQQPYAQQPLHQPSTTAAPPYAPPPPQPHGYQSQPAGWSAPRGYAPVATDPDAVLHEVDGKKI